MSETTRRQDGPDRPNESTASPMRTGQMVGPYVLIEFLGRGGLGEVWLAQRVQGDYRPEVAIKLLLGHDLSDSEAMRRFDRERRILAQLDHPDIARLIDAGRFGPGWPYLVMERIDGAPLDQAVEGLGLRQRIRLFIRICRALQYAHRRLVIHRDLKPANILVTHSGEPRLLDFNTAKLIELEEDPELTRIAPPMTPRYASPEQVRFEELTTATDLYSLGVMLFELITGQSPYEDHTTSSYELDRTICELNPPPASRSGLGDRSLDAIVAKAMSKHPERRYATADALADDLEDWLEQRPIAARPIGRIERFGLLLRRHPTSAVLITSLAALLIGASGLFYWQMQEARFERDVALAVTEFLESLFEASDPGSTSFNGDDLFSILDARAQALQDNPPNNVRIASRLLSSLAVVQAGFGRFQAASDLFEQAYATRNDASILIRHSNVLIELGEYDRAQLLLENASQDLDSLTQDDRSTLAASQAQFELLQGQLDRALSLARAAVEQATGGEARALALDTLAQVLSEVGELDEAAAIAALALEETQRVYGTEHIQLTVVMNNLALIEAARGREDAALALLQKSIEISERILGPNDPRMAIGYDNLANRLSLADRLDEAISAHQKAFQITTEQLGETNRQTGIILNNRATTRMRQGRWWDAEQDFFAALEVFTDETTTHALISINAAGVLAVRGEARQALSMLAAAEAVLAEQYAMTHPRRVRLRQHQALARILTESVADESVFLDPARAGNGPDMKRSLDSERMHLDVDVDRLLVELIEVMQGRCSSDVFEQTANRSLAIQSPAIHYALVQAVLRLCMDGSDVDVSG
ncbi:MAG: serine/threonine-protein kinase [Pseudomonadota bacterium]